MHFIYALFKRIVLSQFKGYCGKGATVLETAF
jgi:hypothetical protein